MRLPRDWSGEDLVKRLSRLGYEVTRQSGSHVRLTQISDRGDHHVTVPMHSPLRLGTLNAILSDVASHLRVDKNELLQELQ